MTETDEGVLALLAQSSKVCRLTQRERRRIYYAEHRPKKGLHYAKSANHRLPKIQVLQSEALPTVQDQVHKFGENLVLENRNENTTHEIPKPKLPISSFYLFCLDEKPKIIEAFPDATFNTVVTKELGCRFLACPLVNLAKYDALVKVDVLRYEKELKEYNKLCKVQKRNAEYLSSCNVRSKKRKSRARRSKSKVPRIEAFSKAIIPYLVEPLSPFFWFCLEKKLTDQEKSSPLHVVELAGILSQQWQKMSPLARSRFEKLAEIDKLRYEKDLINSGHKKPGSVSSESDAEIDEGSASFRRPENNSNCVSLARSEDNCVDAYTGGGSGGVDHLLEIKLEYASDHDD